MKRKNNKNQRHFTKREEENKNTEKKNEQSESNITNYRNSRKK